jgi:3-methyladenine DNA glycosylase/8-oxoguanine DNA glycosylase
MTRTARRVDGRRRDRDRAYRASAEDMTAAAVADSTAREYLRNADPVLARVIDDLPGLDAFGTLIFQVAGQQLSVRATRAILSRLEEGFGGHLPSPAEVLAADLQVLRAGGLSARKGAARSSPTSLPARVSSRPQTR